MEPFPFAPIAARLHTAKIDQLTIDRFPPNRVFPENTRSAGGVRAENSHQLPPEPNGYG